MRGDLLEVEDRNEEIPDIGAGRSGDDRVSGSGKSASRIKLRKRRPQIMTRCRSTGSAVSVNQSPGRVARAVNSVGPGHDASEPLFAM